MSDNFKKEACYICGKEICECNKDKENSVPVKRKIRINFNENSNCESNCCNEEECNCENKKKSLAILGATIVAVGVTGGILYLVKHK